MANRKYESGSSAGHTAFTSPPSNTEHAAFELKSVDEQSSSMPSNMMSIALPVQKMFFGSWKIRSTALDINGNMGARSTLTVSGMPYGRVEWVSKMVGIGIRCKTYGH